MWTYNYTYMRPDELYHYGVPGMKWGKRKAQLKSEYSAKRRKLAQEHGSRADRTALKNEYKNNIKTAKQENRDARKVKRSNAFSNVKNKINASIQKAEAEVKQEETNERMAKVRLAKGKKAAERQGILDATRYAAFEKERAIQIERGRRANLSLFERNKEDFNRELRDGPSVDGYDYDNEDF